MTSGARSKVRADPPGADSTAEEDDPAFVAVRLVT
jgi:hypothetical protein